MIAPLNNYGPLRKEWESWFRINQRRLRSFRQVANAAGIATSKLTQAVNDGVASETIRAALVAAGIPDRLIPLPTDNRALAGIVFAQRKELESLRQRF